MSLDLYRERHGVHHSGPSPLESAERGIASCVRQLDDERSENRRLREELAAQRALYEELMVFVGLRPTLDRAVLASPDEQIGFWAG